MFCMMLVVVVYFVLFSLLTIATLMLFILQSKKARQAASSKNVIPHVSVLLAVRNEEQNVLNCLKALADLDYPEDRLEVLIGDDHSEDGTEAIVRAFTCDRSNFRLVKVGPPLGTAKGKANALAYLAKQATGDVFCITDADIQVTRTWVKELVRHFEPNVGIISGVTLTRPEEGMWAQFQNMEWAFAFAQIQVVTDRGIPVTAVGNNMAVTRACYESVGGYTSIPFSVTEDHELLKQAVKKGWKFKNLMNPQLLNWSEPLTGIKPLLRQRKRWMRGAVQLPWILVLILSLQAMFLPFIFFAFILQPWAASLLWLLKIVLQILLIQLVFVRVGYTFKNHSMYLLFEIYSLLFSLLSVVYYLIPGKVYWKERTY